MSAQPYASTAQLQKHFPESRRELIDMADKHTRAVQAWLASRSPNAVCFNGAGIQAVSTGLGVPLFNLALGCHFPPETEESAILEEIRQVEHFFEARQVPWLWWIGPHTTPADPQIYLQRFNLVPRPLPAMIAPLTAESAFPAIPKNISVWRAQSTQDLQAASKIRHTAFRFPAGEGLTYFEDMPDSWSGENSPAALYLAGETPENPVAMGAVILGAGLPGIYIMATLPNHTRQGYGKAVLARLLTDIRQQVPGATKVVLTASQYGFPLYAQFGFEYLFNYLIYKKET